MLFKLLKRWLTRHLLGHVTDAKYVSLALIVMLRTIM